MLEPLPIDSLIPSILQAVRENPIVIVEAPPGSGKTTRVPPALIASFAVEDRRIVLLQPRRIAVQSVANRIAEESNSKLGHTIGYAVRFDARFNAQTQLLVATEGIVRRMLSDDISLSNVSVVVFDEFHERSLDSDLLLAMCRHLQSTIRPDLKIVIMSATISSESISQQLQGVPVLRAEGRMFPVDIRYAPMNARDKLSNAVAQCTAEAIQKHQGDALVFLPGKGEIFQVQGQLEGQLSKEIEIVPLFGAMTMEQQSYAVRTSQRRRVILSTNIAETSLTIEGIRIVIDSGMARVLRYDPTSGLDRLCLEPICRASADQRAGRAGRVAPGVTYRLWSEASQRAKVAYLEPELHRVDFASALLQLYAWNESEIEQLPWLEPPRETNLSAAVRLLDLLGATYAGELTDLGKQMADLPLHPRLARLVIEGKSRNAFNQTAWAAAMLSEREPFIRSSSAKPNASFNRPRGGSSVQPSVTQQPKRWPCDVCEQLEAIAESQQHGNSITKFGEIHRNTLSTIAKVAEQIQRDVQCKVDSNDDVTQQDAIDIAIRKSLLAAFPDRLAKRRGRGQERALMVGGKGVKLSHESGVVQHDLFICLDAEASGSEASVRKASGIEREWLTGDNIRTVDELFYSPTHKAVQCRRRTYWIDLMLEESPAAISDPTQAAAILAKAALADWQRCFPSDDKELQNLIGRINLLARFEPSLQLHAVDQARLQSVCESICRNVTSLDQIKSANWSSYLVGSLNAEQASALHRLCPAKVSAPNGRQFTIDYSQDQPILAIKIQDAFGMRQNPRVCDGKQVVQMHLLAPNMRTQQITNDLASFWASGYEVCKKELKRRYAKHAWPDDPTVPLP